jgi:hypothetical protein
MAELVVIVAVKMASNMYIKNRRYDRLERANSMLTDLINAGYSLVEINDLCEKKRSWFGKVSECDIDSLSNGYPAKVAIRDTAKALIYLSGRSETVYNHIQSVLEMGPVTFIVTNRTRDLTRELVEAGYDLAELKEIAERCKSNGSWTVDDVTHAVQTLLENDTARSTINDQAIEHVIEFVTLYSGENGALMENLINGIIEIGMEGVMNTWELIDGLFLIAESIL